MAQAAAAGPEGAEKDADGDDRRAEVALQHQEDKDAGKHRRKRHEDLLELADAVRVAVDPVCDENGEGELPQLRRLKCAERPGVEPTARPVDADPEVWDEDQATAPAGASGRIRR